MKRIGGLFAQIIERENLLLAFHRAARGKRFRTEVRDSQDELQNWLVNAPRRLAQGEFVFGRFHQFMICDPKQRIITAPCFEERVVHHAIMNVCEPVMDRWLIGDTYACRLGLGREAAVRRAAKFCRTGDWCLKLDVRRYFDSINHERLLGLLAQRFKDPHILGLFERIVRSFRGAIGAGLPIGSLMSQHFANFYLGWLDRFVKETLLVRGYVRYMDDMLFWGNDRRELQQVHYLSEKILVDMLGLEFKLSQVRPVQQGISFLGCQLFPTHVELNRRSKSRWKTRTRFLEKAHRLGAISDREVQQRLTSLTGFAKSGGVRSWKFRQSVLEPREVDEP
jgi:RNA-directed DNA polymerase